VLTVRPNPPPLSVRGPSSGFGLTFFRGSGFGLTFFRGIGFGLTFFRGIGFGLG
jgi:hypothetical protein